MGLGKYHEKRDFERTPEPEGKVASSREGKLYIIQKHAASRLHYDLRLELDGVLKSWAVPKGPSLKPGEKRLAVHVEDHPIDYGSFEGIIPEGEYGGGTVMLWDRGIWAPLEDPQDGYAKGNLKFRLYGEKIKGSFVLARMKGNAGEEGKNWLLIKKHDEAAIAEGDPEPVAAMTRSVASGRTMEQIASEREKIWLEGEAVSGSDVPADPPVQGMKGSRKGRGTDSAAKFDPSSLSGALPAALPSAFRPELATLAVKPPSGEGWIHEIKYDGYRIMCIISGERIRLVSRNGREWTERFSSIAEAASKFGLESAILDGEIVVMDKKGKTDFQALQNILQGLQTGRLVFLAFDMPYLNGYDLSGTPLLQRKELLGRVLDSSADGSQIVYADHIQGSGMEVFNHACRLDLEGIISKQAESHYLQRRSRNWLKVKCGRRQEFVVGGFTDPRGARSGFGALLLGYYGDGRNLVYSGRVGTGFGEKTLKLLFERLKRLESEQPAFINPPTGYEAKGVHWIKPELVCEVEFSEWTGEGILRHPSFKGLREDKDPMEIVREAPRPDAFSGNAPGKGIRQRKRHGPTRIKPGVKKGAGTKLTLSNPKRVLYPEIEVTKQDLAEYYLEVADWILPHLVGRPLTLVRCPEGWGRECFYQKHLGETATAHLRSIPIVEKEGQEYYSIADTIEGVFSLVQIGVLEIHVWGSRDSALEQPDMMVFDLDPAPEVVWEKMIEAAYLLRERLAGLGLTSFVKTTGGKGLHVVVPLTPEADWDVVKAFSRAVAESIVRESPREYIATMSKQKRRGKIFIDYLRNGRGATSIAAYSTRKRRNAPISTPLAWVELTKDLRPDRYDIRNIRERLAELAEDPWGEYFSVRQTITEEMKKKVGLQD